MKYRHLAAINPASKDENELIFDRRNLGLWRGIIGKLQTAIVDRRNLNLSVDPAVGRPDGQAMRRWVRLTHEIEKHRAWLEREDIQVDADGNPLLDKVKNTKVYYDSDLHRQSMTKIKIMNGILYLGENIFDTTDMVTHFSGPGYAIYVMSDEGNIHVSNHIVGKQHHSSLLAGKMVAGAGEIKVKKGKIIHVSNKSGHYMPGPEHFVQVLHHIINKRNCIYRFSITVWTGKNDRTHYDDAGIYLNSISKDSGYDFYTVRLLSYGRILTKKRLKKNGWRWRNGAHYEAPGVYEIDGGTRVDSRKAYMWAKEKYGREVGDVRTTVQNIQMEKDRDDNIIIAISRSNFYLDEDDPYET